MTLPEIFVQLPEEIQVALETALIKCSLQQNPSSEQILSATELIVNDLKNFQFPSAPSTVRDLLDQIPGAVVNLLT